MTFQIFPCLFILITFYLPNQVFSLGAPVVLWSNVNLPQYKVPYSTFSSLNLISDYICQLPNEQIGLQLFVVNNLKIEDIQQALQRDDPILVDAKNEQTNFRYFPIVDDKAYNTFLFAPKSNNMKCSHKRLEIISSQTYETFSEASNSMKVAIDNMATDANKAVVFVLVNGPDNSQKLSRRRRQTNETAVKVLTSADKTCMFYAEQLRWNDVNGTKSTGRNYSLNFSASSCKPNTTNSNSSSSVILDLTWVNDNAPFDSVKMSLITTISGVYWNLENATLNNSEYRYFAYGMYDRMTTPPAFSYVCTTGTFVRYDRSINHGQYNFTDKFYLLNLQFQPFNVNQTTFGPPNYCTSFFTSGIWMGITSSLLCLFILLFGIRRMMTIKSNDRFDDPKGKPLVIKAQE